jgi:hydrogenase maturation protease
MVLLSPIKSRTARAASGILIAGVGNELLSDDGVGVHAIRELQREGIAGIAMLEVGTAILHALETVGAASRVLVIDAARGNCAPGTIYRYDLSESAPGGVASLHSLGLRDGLRLLGTGSSIPRFTVLGVEPLSFDYGLELSVPVRAAMPKLLSLARQTVAEWAAVPAKARQKPGFELPSLELDLEEVL